MRIPALLIALTALTLPAASPAEPRPPVERLPQVKSGGTPRPFSEGVRVGDMLYLSGQIGAGPDGTLPAGMDAQAHNVMDHIGGSLKKAGVGWKNVTRCLVMLENMSDWPAFNAIYATYVDPANLPARSAFGADGLALGALVEVQCDAYVPQK